MTASLISIPTDARGNVEVAIQDQFSEIIDLHLTLLIETLSLLNNQAVEDNSIDIRTLGVVPAVGEFISLKEGVSFFQGEIISVTPISGNDYTVLLDSPLDFAFTTSSVCSLRDPDLSNAIGTPGSPIIYDVSPKNLDASMRWDITRLLMSMVHSSAADDGKFGGITALTNGIVIRRKNGVFKNIFNAQTNGDMALHAFNVDYTDKAGGGLNGTRVRKTFSGVDKAGVTIRLDNNADPNLADELQILIQDNLTGLTKFEVVAQGHVVED